MNKIQEFLESDKSAKEWLNENGGKYGCVMLGLLHSDFNFDLLNARHVIPIENIYSHF
jgi:hypothetical protein